MCSISCILYYMFGNKYYTSFESSGVYSEPSTHGSQCHNIGFKSMELGLSGHLEARGQDL